MTSAKNTAVVGNGVEGHVHERLIYNIDDASELGVGRIREAMAMARAVRVCED